MKKYGEAPLNLVCPECRIPMPHYSVSFAGKWRYFGCALCGRIECVAREGYEQERRVIAPSGAGPLKKQEVL